MGNATFLADEQLRALARLSAIPAAANFYLAGGTAFAFHLGHRHSRDLDLFSLSPEANLEALRVAIVAELPATSVVAATDATLRLRVETTPLDIVRYPYAPLEKPLAGPGGFPTAGLLDLATMKLSAIAKRGIRRDFWDLHAAVDAGTVSLAGALDAYVQRFGVSDSDVYHVLRSLAYFDDAEKESVMPEGLGADHWERIKSYFRRAAPEVLAARAQ